MKAGLLVLITVAFTSVFLINAQAKKPDYPYWLQGKWVSINDDFGVMISDIGWVDNGGVVFADDESVEKFEFRHGIAKGEFFAKVDGHWIKIEGTSSIELVPLQQ